MSDKTKLHHLVIQPISNRKQKLPDYSIWQFVEGYNQSNKYCHHNTPITHQKYEYRKQKFVKI